MQTITILLLVLAIYGKTAHSLSQELRDHALKIHNGYRMNITGTCQMQRMVYDEELERQATRWANRCVFKHEMVKGRGENLAWNTAKSPETELMNNAAKSWYDEVRMYSYGQSSCSSSCHYTQMVWAKTNRVGCATKRCSYLTYAYADAWYFVCFYTPMGNMYGEKPYPRQPCSPACIDGQTKDSDGLCVGGGNGEEDNGGEEEGTTAEVVCEDKDSRCVGWAKTGECTKNPAYMHTHCTRACAFCGDECKDVHGKCAAWASNNQCTENPTYMNHYCKLSCNAC